MNTGFSKARLARMRDVMASHVTAGQMPGLVALVARHGDVHVDAMGTLDFDGKMPMRRDSILSRPSVELMMTDQLIPEQKIGADLFFGANRSWGFGASVFTRRDDLSAVPGRYGWEGGYGTSAYVDPKEELVGVLLTQRLMDSPEAPHVLVDFWTQAYAAIDD